MTGFFFRLVITALGLWAAATVVPGVRIDGWGNLVVAALLLGIVNAVIRPIILILTLPLTVLALGLFVCAYALYVMLGYRAERRLSRRWAAPAGAFGGIVGALFGMGGPPYVVYITGRIPDPAVQRATISQMVILNVGLRVVAFAVAGLLGSRALWIAVMLLLPVAWAGVWIGNRVHGSVTPATMARLIGAALFLTGAALIVRTF